MSRGVRCWRPGLNTSNCGMRAIGVRWAQKNASLCFVGSRRMMSFLRPPLSIKVWRITGPDCSRCVIRHNNAADNTDYVSGKLCRAKMRNGDNITSTNCEMQAKRILKPIDRYYGKQHYSTDFADDPRGRARSSRNMVVVLGRQGDLQSTFSGNFPLRGLHFRAISPFARI